MQSMTLTPGPQRALGSRGQTINADAWPYFDALIREVSRRTGASYDDLVVEALRTRARQSYLYDGYRFGRIDPSTGRKFNPAYPPDSPYAYHVAGDAVDFGAGAGTRGTPVQKALHELGPLYGIFFEVASELWHGRSDPARRPSTIPAGNGATPIEEDFLSDAQYNDLVAKIADLQKGLNAIGDTTRADLDNTNRLGEYARAAQKGLDGIADDVRAVTAKVDFVQKSVDIVGDQNRAAAVTATDRHNGVIAALTNLGKTLTTVWGVANNIARKVGAPTIEK